MYLRKEDKKILWVFILAIVFFTTTFIAQQNYEFIGYVVFVFLLFTAVLYSNKHVEYPSYVLWGLLLWAILHMLGGVLMANGNVVYTFIVYPIIGEPYNILKYDQVIHAYGFFIATLVMFVVLKKYLPKQYGWWAVGIVVAMAGLGLGAFNEIIEFLMVVTLPHTNVGGYENTALDLVFNFIGAVLAVFFIRYHETKNMRIAEAKEPKVLKLR